MSSNLQPISIISKFFNIKIPTILEIYSMDRDVHNLFNKYKVNISFNSEEGLMVLNLRKIKENEKFVCVALVWSI